MSPKTFLSDFIHNFFAEKSSPVISNTSEIFKKLPKENSRPIGENHPIRSPWFPIPFSSRRRNGLNSNSRVGGVFALCSKVDIQISDRQNVDKMSENVDKMP
jgi:hypothetical protein